RRLNPWRRTTRASSDRAGSCCSIPTATTSPGPSASASAGSPPAQRAWSRRVARRRPTYPACMFKALKRWWKYLTAKVSGSLDERADPKIQIQQAISEAQEQHRRLREQAANVIANQKQLEMQLSRTMGELEKANSNARQALMMQSQASQGRNPAKAAEYEAAAESIATRLIELEKSA